MTQLAMRFDTVQRSRRLAAIWFVRMAWVPVLAWGLTSTTPDAAVRTGTGVILFLIWLFAVRTFGPFTLNRDGRLE
jgi:hypothetical protein